MLSLDLPETGTSKRDPSRREFLVAGGLPFIGLQLSGLLKAQSAEVTSQSTKLGSPTFGKAKSCIIVLLKGGPSHIDTFDMKPDAPSEIRGEFRPISTNASGIQVCEHLPRLAKNADKFALLRSMRLRGDATHGTGAYEVTTGHRYPRPGESVYSPTDFPHYGSVVSAVDGGQSVMPFAMLPSYFIVNGDLRGGQNAGMLGARHDPFVPGGGPGGPTWKLMQSTFAPQIEVPRLRHRGKLLSALDAKFSEHLKSPVFAEMDGFNQRAFSLLEKGTVRKALDIETEPQKNLERYGKNDLGESSLLARRLVEAGVRLVQVNCMSTILDSSHSWDTHYNNFTTLKERLLPKMDSAVASLLEDLAATGLLDSTLVVVLGEFGRSPRVNAQAGRDHWPACFSALLAGAGIPGGRVVGASDRYGASPIDCPVSTGQLAATIYHALGIDPGLSVQTWQGRPFWITEDSPVMEMWG